MLPTALGVPVGLAWWLLAPTAPVGALPTGTLVAPSAPELAAAQDGVLVLLGAGAGLVCGLLALARSGRSPTARALAVLLGCALGSLVAWAVGTALGPAPLADQVATDPGATPLSPLTVHSPAVLVVWPAVAALVATAGNLALAWRDAPGDAAPGDAEVSPPPRRR